MGGLMIYQMKKLREMNRSKNTTLLKAVLGHEHTTFRQGQVLQTPFRYKNQLYDKDILWVFLHWRFDMGSKRNMICNWNSASNCG